MLIMDRQCNLFFVNNLSNEENIILYDEKEDKILIERYFVYLFWSHF